MRMAEDRVALRVKRGTRDTYVTSFSSEAAALRLLGHEGKPEIGPDSVVRWRFPASAKPDAARVTQEARRASAERHALWREGSAAPAGRA
jgi:hypothetical protein